MELTRGRFFQKAFLLDGREVKRSRFYFTASLGISTPHETTLLCVCP